MAKPFKTPYFLSSYATEYSNPLLFPNPGKRREEVYSFIVPIQTIKVAKQENVFPSTIILNSFLNPIGFLTFPEFVFSFHIEFHRFL